MSNRFDYLIQKIRDADFRTEPFRHVYMDRFFSESDFREIVGCPEIRAPRVDSDDALFDALYGLGYKIIDFPGCISAKTEYVDWHAGRVKRILNTSCEGFGVTLRLCRPASGIIAELDAFLRSDEFNRCVADKFDVKLASCNVDVGIQKYLDGYEISPHPDIRRKATTFMVNINPNEQSEGADHHTHYMRLKADRRYVETFWQGNKAIDRCWLPWDWCDTVYQQTRNNSIVLFAPSDDTLHGVRARYDHLVTQRTQLYGNLWHKESTTRETVSWERLDVTAPRPAVSRPLLEGLMGGPRRLRRKVMGTLLRRNPDRDYDVPSRHF